MLRLGVGGIEIYHVAIAVGLLGFHQFAVFLQCEIMSVGVTQKHELHGRLAEFFIRKHAVLNKYLDVVPLLFECGAVGSEKLAQTSRHFFGDIAGNLLYRAVALQI